MCSTFKHDQSSCVADPMCDWRGSTCTQRFYEHQSLFGVIIASFVVFNVAVTYLLVLAPVWKNFEQGAAQYVWMPSGLRTTIMFITFICALVVPFFGEVVGVISALTLVALQMFTPVIMIEGISKRTKQTVTIGRTAWHATIVICGLLAMGIGLYINVQDLVKALKAHPETLTELFNIHHRSFWTGRD